MAVYVDSARIPNGRAVMCHMVADSIEELNAMADKIGIDRRCIQRGMVSHYDICMSKRKLAVEHGAIELDKAAMHRKMWELVCVV